MLYEERICPICGRVVAPVLKKSDGMTSNSTVYEVVYRCKYCEPFNNYRISRSFIGGTSNEN